MTHLTSHTRLQNENNTKFLPLLLQQSPIQEFLETKQPESEAEH